MTIPAGYRQSNITSLTEMDRNGEYRLGSKPMHHYPREGWVLDGANYNESDIQEMIDVGCPVYERIPECRNVRTVVRMEGHVNGGFVELPASIPIGANVLVVYPVPEGEEE
jgi:hypothetical protein